MKWRINIGLIHALLAHRAWTQAQLAQEAGLPPSTVSEVLASGLASKRTAKVLASLLGDGVVRKRRRP